MHGGDIRDLNIYTREVTSRRTNLVQHLTGAWSTEKIQQFRSFGGNEAWWNEMNVEINPSIPVQVKDVHFESDKHGDQPKLNLR